MSESGTIRSIELDNFWNLENGVDMVRSDTNRMGRTVCDCSGHGRSFGCMIDKDFGIREGIGVGGPNKLIDMGKPKVVFGDTIGEALYSELRRTLNSMGL